MSASDAEIVRRIRERDPDHRFGGGTDVELLDLLKHNKRVLERNDEDVIAAMTRPREMARASASVVPSPREPQARGCDAPATSHRWR